MIISLSQSLYKTNTAITCSALKLAFTNWCKVKINSCDWSTGCTYNIFFQYIFSCRGNKYTGIQILLMIKYFLIPIETIHNALLNFFKILYCNIYLLELLYEQRILFHLHLGSHHWIFYSQKGHQCLQTNDNQELWIV